MGRHRTQDEKRALGERARALRAAGRSRAEVRAELGIGDDLAKELLRGVPLPDSLRRPRAKDDVRAAATALRRDGRTYDEIARELGVSKSTCSLWLRDVPAPDLVPLPAPILPADERRAQARALRADGLLLKDIAGRLGVCPKTVYYWTFGQPVPAAARPGRDPAHLARARRAYWDGVLAERQAERERVRGSHQERVGELSARELELLAVTAYWCEGSKSKTYARREQVTFINSDPGLVLLFLRYLDLVEFPDEQRRYSLSIHESADVPRAEAHWSALLGVPVTRLGPSSLKRHNTSTARKNTGEAYVGCLVVRLVRCRELYQRIEGVWQGIMDGLGATPDQRSRVV